MSRRNRNQYQSFNQGRQNGWGIGLYRHPLGRLVWRCVCRTCRILGSAYVGDTIISLRFVLIHRFNHILVLYRCMDFDY